MSIKVWPEAATSDRTDQPIDVQSITIVESIRSQHLCDMETSLGVDQPPPPRGSTPFPGGAARGSWLRALGGTGLSAYSSRAAEAEFSRAAGPNAVAERLAVDSAGRRRKLRRNRPELMTNTGDPHHPARADANQELPRRQVTLYL